MLSQPAPPVQEELDARAQRYGRNAVRPPREVTFWQLVAEALQASVGRAGLACRPFCGHLETTVTLPKCRRMLPHGLAAFHAPARLLSA